MSGDLRVDFLNACTAGNWEEMCRISADEIPGEPGKSGLKEWLGVWHLHQTPRPYYWSPSIHPYPDYRGPFIDSLKSFNALSAALLSGNLIVVNNLIGRDILTHEGLTARHKEFCKGTPSALESVISKGSVEVALKVLPFWDPTQRPDTTWATLLDLAASRDIQEEALTETLISRLRKAGRLSNVLNSTMLKRPYLERLIPFLSDAEKQSMLDMHATHNLLLFLGYSDLNELILKEAVAYVKMLGSIPPLSTAQTEIFRSKISAVLAKKPTHPDALLFERYLRAPTRWAFIATATELAPGGRAALTEAAATRSPLLAAVLGDEKHRVTQAGDGAGRDRVLGSELGGYVALFL